jgi:hypothetical protein
MIFRYHDLSGGRMQPRRIPINQYGLTTIKLKFWALGLYPDDVTDSHKPLPAARWSDLSAQSLESGGSGKWCHSLVLIAITFGSTLNGPPRAKWRRG